MIIGVNVGLQVDNIIYGVTVMLSLRFFIKSGVSRTYSAVVKAN